MSVQALVDRATDPLLPSVDWTVNFQVVDAINSNTKLVNPVCQAVLNVIQKKHKKSSVLAIELLETLLKNCSSTYKVIGTQEFLKELVANTIYEGATTSVQTRALDWIQFFGRAFQNAKELHFTPIYTMLKVRGINFPGRRDEEWAPEGYKKASNSSSPYDTAPDANSPITTENLYFKITSLTNTRNLFEELMSKLKPGEEKNNEVLNELYQQCKDQQKQVVQWVEGPGATSVQTAILDQLITINNNLLKSISRWEKIKSDPAILQRRQQRVDEKTERDDPMAAIVNRQRPPRANTQRRPPQQASSPFTSPTSPVTSPFIPSYRPQMEPKEEGDVYFAERSVNMLDLI